MVIIHQFFRGTNALVIALPSPPPFDLLLWYLDAGADEAIGDEPVDRFVAVPAPAVVRGDMPPLVAAPVVSGPTAQALAEACSSLEELRHAMEGFDGLSLKRTSLSTVFADGNPEAPLMIIGEAPGQEEDRQGLPFVGRSGKLLDKMLASIGRDRSSVYITNIVPWRPVENRKPTAEEMALCLPFLNRHLELVAPRVLLLLGGTAASALLGRPEGINRLRGQWFSHPLPGASEPLPVLATFHPAYLLRTPAAKREAWRDLLAVQQRL